MNKIIKIVLGALVAITILTGCTKGVVDTKEDVVEQYPVLNVEKGLYGYVNKNGEYKIEPKFVDARTFKDGYAVVNMGKDEDVNLVDKNGKIVFPEDN